jgi:hypothetical protein
MQSRNLKDEEYFDRELLRGKKSLVSGKLCIHGQISLIMAIKTELS